MGEHATSAASDTRARTGTATALGFAAVLLWSTLAVLTVLKGPAVPPFQTTAITFAIGGAVILGIAALRGRLGHVPPPPAAFALGLYGLLVYHLLYFAALALAPAAEASLVASLWALFTVLFAGFLPGATLRAKHVAGGLVGLAAAALLARDGLGGSAVHPNATLGMALALGCALVWSSYSVLSRLVAAVPSEALALPCLATALVAALAGLQLETWSWPPSGMSWVALVLLGLGPVGVAFPLWDMGMKHGNVPLLGVLAYAAPVVSTALLVLAGLAEPRSTLLVACLLMAGAAWIAAR
jgi:drug/metabolite transporter (DMT)-like permease